VKKLGSILILPHAVAVTMQCGRFNDKIKIRTEASPDPLLFRVGFRERVWKLKESIKGEGSPFLGFLLIFQPG
jgi:hypothetical protein